LQYNAVVNLVRVVFHLVPETNSNCDWLTTTTCRLTCARWYIFYPYSIYNGLN